MANGERVTRFDHVVALMFENRSFDNLLGYLYPAGAVAGFEGVDGQSLSNPIPPDATGADRRVVPVHPAANRHTPDPDPGEEHPHTNTQLYGTVNPSANRYAAIDDMRAPFNAPADPSSLPSMQGFVADYINAFRTEMGEAPTYDDYAQIMACYTPDQVPVLSTLAKGFVCFDHWFCEVPSQTYPNRSFFHAASSSGYVLNGPPGKFATGNEAPTIFERLEAAHLRWKVYIDPAQLLPVTGLIHARRLAPYFATHFGTIFDFFDAAKRGALPEYAFIEPNMFHPHTDMHPPGAGRLRHDLHLPSTDSLAGGEQLLARVYEAVRSGTSTSGSNWSNTLLLVTFDEHGGTYDHVPPPAAPPPDVAAPPGEEGFRFDRSGVRIPTLVVSAWVDPGTLVHEEFRSTSLIRTLRERWSLGEPLTGRDAVAPDLGPVLNRTRPRLPEEWPNVPVPREGILGRIAGGFADMLEFERLPMGALEREIIGEGLAHEAAKNGETLSVKVESLTHLEAHAHARRIRDQFFAGVTRGRQQ